jgi:hypothetical protein
MLYVGISSVKISLAGGDDDMTHQVLIFGLCGLKSRSKPAERMIKAHRCICLAQPMKPKLGVHCKNSKEKT